MDISSAIKSLEQEWDFDTGSLGRLRRGEFDVDGLRRLLIILELIKPQKGEVIDRRLVSLLWYMPIFMNWQKERVQEAGGDLAALEKATNQVQSIVERILGLP